MLRTTALVLVLVLAPSALVGCSGSDNPPDADERTAAREALVGYLDALRGGDAEEVCSMLTQSEIQDLDVPTSCREVYTEAFALLDEQGVQLPVYDIGAVTVDGERAEVRLTSEATDVTVPLAKEEGVWKLAGTTSIAQFHPDNPLPGGPGG
jgi:hypothetical protein